MIGWIINRAATIREKRAAVLYQKEMELERRGKELQRETEQLVSDKASLERYRTETEKSLERDRIEQRQAIETLAKEKALGFPWLARAYNEYFKLTDERLARRLENEKHPAKRSANAVRVIAREKSALRRENKMLRDLHRYYEYLFAWLIDFKREDLDEVIPLSSRTRNRRRMFVGTCHFDSTIVLIDVQCLESMRFTSRYIHS